MRHPFDLEFGVQTSGLVSGRHLKAGHAHDRHNTAYYGVAPSIFRDICERWRRSQPAFPMESYSFIDLGAGMGRGMLLAAEMPFREVIGVELNPELSAIAEKNLAAWAASSRARCPMRIHAQDATEFEFPGSPCVVFLFNPFSAAVLRRLIKRIERDFRDRPGQLDLLYVNHESERVLARHVGFARIFSGDIYKSSEDEVADREILLNQPEGEYAASNYESCSIYRWTGRLSRRPTGTSSATSSVARQRAAPRTIKVACQEKLRVGILFGGRSGEHEVSLLSAASILKAIDPKKYDVVPVGITKDGRWVTSSVAAALIVGGLGKLSARLESAGRGVEEFGVGGGNPAHRAG